MVRWRDTAALAFDHGDSAMTATRLATLDDDGWTLEDGEGAYSRGDGVYWLPPRADREGLQGRIAEEVHAKLIFLIRYVAEDGQSATRGERMWVRVTGRHGRWYHGHLDNQPVTQGSARDGMAVTFGPEHVIDLVYGDGDPLSHDPDLVRCGTHGSSDPCFVCVHLAQGEGLGFHASDDAAVPRPDAWCDACEAILEQFGDWEAAGDQGPEITVLCGGCYDRCRERNQR